MVKDEFDFLTDFKGPVGFDLDLLDNVGSFFGFTILLKESAQGHSGLRIFSFKEHFTLAGLSEGLKHFVFVGPSWELLKELILAHVYHFNDWLFSLTSSLA